ncbi:uncharacterized protein LOC132309392 [Cornus florida]|uniref:uncharacterized protein LOC132309392 n=1 Tax=Cornus florida TaxID=4283 RepID=UPI002897DF1A|nr:uncharacterized protein LOC132309392 [Cornus florida]
MPAGSEKSGVVCFQYQQPGHYKSNCPMKSSAVPTASRACYGCGQPDHLIRDYPNRGIEMGSGRGSQQRLSQSATAQSGFRPPPPPQSAMSSQGSRPVRRDTPTIGRVTVCTPEGDCFFFMGDRSDFQPSSMYGISG